MRDKNNNCTNQWDITKPRVTPLEAVVFKFNAMQKQIDAQQKQIERLQRDVHNLQNPNGDSQ
jgi:hypothetical protein